MRAETSFDQRVAAMRRFNRFYTQKIGVLEEGLLQSPYSLTEVRLLYELANREMPTPTDLVRDLGLDPGYLSRLLRGLERQGLVRKSASKEDRRRTLLSLTAAGRKTFAPLDAGARAEIAQLLRNLAPSAQERLLEAMQSVEQLLGAQPERKAAYLLRPHQPGDMGWVVQRHGALYHREYGWDMTFEAFVAEVVARFIVNFDPAWEHCWIAEKDGENVGSVFLVRKSRTVAQLRLLLVDPSARGLGIGTRLVDECIGFARSRGYRKISLWTNNVLLSARRIYEAAGFRLVRREKHRSFGHDLVGEFWERALRPRAARG
jgi:DNA-binding MarR family transcriptional regulator/GNAT superfamily N-acetyltransferase